MHEDVAAYDTSQGRCRLRPGRALCHARWSPFDAAAGSSRMITLARVA